MRTIVCDRCKAEIIPANRGGICGISPYYKLKKVETRVNQDGVAFDLEKKLDLCDSCMSDLTTWLSSKSARKSKHLIE